MSKKKNNDELNVESLKEIFEKYDSELGSAPEHNEPASEEPAQDGKFVVNITPESFDAPSAPAPESQGSSDEKKRKRQPSPQGDTPAPEDDFGMPCSLPFEVNLGEEEANAAVLAAGEMKLQAESANKPEGSRFKRLIKGLFPWRGDGVAEIVRKCVFLAAMLTIVISCGVLIDSYIIEPNQAEKAAGTAKDNLIDENSDTTLDDLKKKYPDIDFPDGIQLKYAEVYAKNTDLIGWLNIDKLGIDFPIMQTGNNDDYLRRDFNLKWTELGNPFLNAGNSADPLDRNSVIYGHSTRTNNKLFSPLFDYRTVRGFVNNPIIEFNTIFKDYKWKVYAAFISNAKKSDDNGYVFNYYYENVSSDEVFAEYIEEIDRRKLYTTGVDILPSDKILTLSTCLYDFDDGRLVIVARMVRDGESAEVDTSKAAENPNPQYPQAWYDKKGQTNPYRDTERWYPH